MKKVIFAFTFTCLSFQVAAHKYEGQLPDSQKCREATEFLLRLTVELDKTVTGQGRTDILREIHNLSGFIRLCSDEGYIKEVPSLKLD